MAAGTVRKMSDPDGEASLTALRSGKPRWEGDENRGKFNRQPAMSTVVSSLVEIDENGIALITGANTKVIEVVLDTLAHGSSPEEIHFQHPHLSLAQIHAALSFYHEHRPELEAEIRRRWVQVNELAAKEAGSPLHQRL